VPSSTKFVATDTQGSLAYVDTSAYLKLLFMEAETAAFELVVREWPDLVSSELLDGSFLGFEARSLVVAGDGASPGG